MRAPWLVFCACSAPAPAPAVPHAEPGAVTTPTHVHARVGREVGPWSDIIVDGTGTHARDVCARIVKSRLAGIGPGDERVLRGCDTARLPTLRGVHLVESEDVDRDSLSAADVVNGVRPPTRVAETTDFRAVMLHITPMSNRADCEASRSLLDAEDEKLAHEWYAAEMRIVDKELAAVIEVETRVCTELQRTMERCTRLTGERRNECVVEASPQEVICNDHKRKHAWLDTKRAARPQNRSAKRSCRER